MDLLAITEDDMRRTSWLAGCFLLGALFLHIAATPSNAQDRERYFLGKDQQLQMLVHVWGEVHKPGKYAVADQTTLLELISSAGGPTDFAKLNAVLVTREAQKDTPRASKVLQINLIDYMQGRSRTPPLRLQPGDVVHVARNSWHRWRSVVSVARDLSVMAGVVFTLMRALQN